VVAVGTCQSFGEDYPGTGRVLFFQITRKPAEGSEAEEQWDANMIYSRYTTHRARWTPDVLLMLQQQCLQC